MRPARFQEFALKAFVGAPGVSGVEAWQDGTSRPYGVKVTLASGGQVWAAITAVSAPGEDYDQPEDQWRKEGEPLEPVEVPEPAAGKQPIAAVERLLAALLVNAANTEIAAVHMYTADREQPSMHPGIGVDFHSGAKAHMVIVHAEPEGRRPGRAYDLPTTI